MTSNEKQLLLAFLDDYSRILANKGCNDYEFPKTSENYEIMRSIVNMLNWGDTESVILEMNNLKKQYEDPKVTHFITYDWLIVNYLKQRLEDAEIINDGI